MKRYIAILVFFLGVNSLYAVSFPRPNGYVMDEAHILSQDTVSQLNSTLASFTASTSNEIAVVTVPSLEDLTIEEYAVKLFESWGVGDKEKDNGVLLLVAPNEREVRIEVGYGLEGAIPDITASDIIDNLITPSFKSEDYDTGVKNGVQALMDASAGEYHADGSKNTKGLGNALEGILIIGFFGIQFLAAILGRSKSWWAGGVLGGVLGAASTFFGVFGLTLFWGSAVTVLLVILGLLFDYLFSSSYTQSIARGGGIPWWVGGGRSGGGGSPFGGFGGGSSGGGGASGSW